MNMQCMPDENSTETKPQHATAQPGKAKNMQLKGRDGYERMNYLYQSALHILRNQPENVELVRYYMRTLRKIKERKVLRWSREMKRSICNGCNMLLVAGITAQIRIRNNRRLVMTCLSCNAVLRANTSKQSSKISAKKKHKTRKKNGDKVKDGKK
ncbi:ribonuclease P protein subunit p21-like [Hydractinia symbiolongicarpus]|uniref:ribonuclease P protein subunit p21-like n=1 Tax=Hydractinia symbiolongicarpus TaxID=13093 RepID=UPI00254FD871|nr:ribonuclease P protein subunit p21-like [Hydractinia symbiolongicarpus]